MDPFTEAIRFTPVPFNPPRPTRARLACGAPILSLEDHTLPLVNLYLELNHGFTHVPDRLFAAAWALDELMRTGGAGDLSPEAVDQAIEGRAIGLEIEISHRSTSIAVGALPRHLPAAVELMATLLREPAFDEAILDVWRGKQLEALRRRNDRPGPIAHRYFNKLIYQGHPLGRSLELEDVGALTAGGLREAHRSLIRPEAMTLGVSGDVSTDAAIALLDRAFSGWEPGDAAMRELPAVSLRRKGGVFSIERELPQSSLVVGQPGGIAVEDSPDYFATRVLNFVLGSSGFTSRLTREMRTVRGWAYSARSSWMAAVDGERPLMAVTETRTETTVPALGLIRDIFRGFLDAPPKEEEVRVAQDNIRHSFLFEFEVPSHVVYRQVSHLSRGLPADWSDRYLAGIASTTPQAVHEVARRYLRPEALTMVVVGDRARFTPELETLGPVTSIELEP